MDRVQVVMGLSGGMDSATLLGYLLEKEMEVICCTFDYGSTHGKYEMEAAEKVINFYSMIYGSMIYGGRVRRLKIDMTKIFPYFSSSLLVASGREIPEGNYDDDNMKQTVVPGRNLIFASIMAGLAESLGAQKVALGVHSGDHHIYPDCRTEFVKALDTTVYLSSDRKVEVIAPFLNLNKADILNVGYSLQIPVPYHLTRTCYKNQPVSCGKCGSCTERLEAFAKIGKKDPIPYTRA